jgi:hypothetical protein
LVLAFLFLKNKNNVLHVWLVQKACPDSYRDYKKSYRSDGRGAKQKTEDFEERKNWVLFCVALGSGLFFHFTG